MLDSFFPEVNSAYGFITGYLSDSVLLNSFTDYETVEGGGLRIFAPAAYSYVFQEIDPAFAGYGSIHYTWLDQSPLPPGGHTGNIYTFSLDNNPIFLGTYLVVPEPSTLLLGGLGMAALAFLHRHRQKGA